MTIRKRGNSYQVDVPHTEKERFRFSVKSEIEAKAEEAQAELAYSKGLVYLSPAERSKQQREERDFSEAKNVTRIKDIYQLGFLYDCTVRDVWSNQKDSKGSSATGRACVDYFGANTDYRLINGQRVDEFIQYLKELGNAGGTINRKTAALSRMFKLSREKGWSDHQPHIRKQKEADGRIRYITKSEEEVILTWHEKDGKPLYSMFWTVLLDTGFRVSEALSIDLSKDLTRDMNDNYLLSCWENKAGLPRTIPLSKRVVKFFKSCIEEGNYKPFSKTCQTNINKNWDRMRLNMNLQNDSQFVPHCLRHTCATRLISSGVDIVTVQQWLGHKTLTMTQRYAHVQPHMLIDALNKRDNVVSLSAHMR